MGKAAEIDLQPLEPVLAEYAAKPGSLITILQHTQDIYGYLPQPALAKISEAVGVAPAKVLGVASFYTQFRLQPVGRYSDYAVPGHGLPRERGGEYFRYYQLRSWALPTAKPRRTVCLH